MHTHHVFLCLPCMRGRRAVRRAFKYRANHWYNESDSTEDDERTASAFRIGHRAGTAVLPPCSTPQQLTEHQNKNTRRGTAGAFILVELLDSNSKNYIAVVQYRRKSHAAPVDEPIDPTITDTSYDPNSTVKEITQQQKTLSQAEIQAVIQKYEAGASTYELADEFGCHRSTISAVLKRNGTILPSRLNCRVKNFPSFYVHYSFLRCTHFAF